MFFFLIRNKVFVFFSTLIDLLQTLPLDYLSTQREYMVP